jgi:heme-degrading monooxygenase HmoA
MYSRATLVEVDAMRSRVEEALELYKENVLPRLQEQEGFQGVVVMATPEGKGLVLSLWETAGQATANEETGFYPNALAQFVTLFASPPGRESYEVVYADVPAVAVR